MEPTKRKINQIVTCLQQDSFDIKIYASKPDDMATRNKFSDVAGRLNKIIQDLQKLGGEAK